MKTLPTPPTRPQEAPTLPLALRLALAGLPRWDVRLGRLDAELDDLRELVGPASGHVPVTCPASSV